MVARAPGRLDVMGGIADYSGSLVLQLPLAQACHVAAQLRPVPPGMCILPSKDKCIVLSIAEANWRSSSPYALLVREFVFALPTSISISVAGEQSLLRIVSLGGGGTDRAPSFEMPLSELLPDGRPLPLTEARAMFADDTARRRVYATMRLHQIRSLTVSELYLLRGLKIDRLCDKLGHGSGALAA